MAYRFLDGVKFQLERFLLRGPHYRLLFVAAVIGLLSVVAGAMVLPSGTFESFSDAVWWAFLRLSDPGYLGDDEGVLVRTISTALTVSGYVVFLGSLVAIMTQWLNATMARLESGLTPIRRRGHVVILGWTSRTVPLVQELLRSEERVKRFLQLRGHRSLHVVILAEEVTPALRQDLKDELGELWDEARITLRSGNPLREEHLIRVDCFNASAVLLPGADEAGERGSNLDARTIRSLLSMGEAVLWDGDAGRNPSREAPYAVAEVYDARKVGVARRSYPGPVEVVASDAAISRLLAQNLRHPGLSRIYNELLASGAGNEIYLPEVEELEGQVVEAVHAAFPGGVVLGVARWEGERVRPFLNPPARFRLQKGDRVAVMSADFGSVRPPHRAGPVLWERGEGGDGAPVRDPQRILLLGWSRKAPALLRELSTYRDAPFTVDAFSTLPAERRASHVNRYGVPSQDLELRHLEGDYGIPGELLRLDPLAYDGVVFLGSDRLASEEDADARTLMGGLLLQELGSGEGRMPTVLVELLDPGNASLLDRAGAEVLVSPMLVSHILAQVALRRELRAVFEELFTAGGPEIVFRTPATYGLKGQVDFETIQRAVLARGDTALGVRPLEMTGGHSGPPGVLLNPDRSLAWQVEVVDIVCLEGR